jgi:colicin import membrane protein
VGNHWIKPSNFPVGQKCVVRVQLIPGGEVAAVDADCGGNEVFETSVEHAVRSASPLPIPRDVSMFEHFKRIKFDFYNPEEK